MHQLHFSAHFDPQLGVEVGQRLVKQVNLRPPRQCPPHRHALLLTTRQLTRLAGQQVLDLQQLGNPCDFFFNRLRAHFADLETEGDVVAHVHGWIQRVGLKYHGDITVLGAHAADVGIVHQNRPATDGLKTGNAVHQGRLTAARRPHQNQKFAIVDFQFNVFQRVGQTLAVGFIHVT